MTYIKREGVGSFIVFIIFVIAMILIAQAATSEERISITSWDGIEMARYQHNEWFIETSGRYDTTSSTTKDRVTVAGREWAYPLIDEKLFAIGELGAVWHEVKWKRGYKDDDLSGMMSVGLGYQYKNVQLGAGYRRGIPGIESNVDDDKAGDRRELRGFIVSLAVLF